MSADLFRYNTARTHRILIIWEVVSMNTFRKLCLSMTMSFALIACSSNNNGGNTEAAEKDMLGIIQITDLAGNLDESAMAFYNVDPAISASTLSALVTTERDTCTISFEPAIGSPVPQLNSTLTDISAGEVITLSGPAGSFSEATRQQIAENFIYYTPDELTAPVPSGLLVNIPGNEFPQLADIAIPDIEPFVLTSHNFGESTGIANEITWQAGTNPDAFIRIYLISSYTFTNSDSQRVEGDLDLECTLADDGGFTFTTAQQTQLSDAGLDNLTLNIGRVIENVRGFETALMLIRRQSGDL